MATVPLTSEEVLQQALASSLSAISAVATSFGARRPSVPGSQQQQQQPQPSTVAAASAPSAATVATPAVVGAVPDAPTTFSITAAAPATTLAAPIIDAAPTALGTVPPTPTTAASTSDPTAGALPTVPTRTESADLTGLGAVALSPQCPPWLLPLSSYCANLLAKPTAAEPLAAGPTAPAVSLLVQETLRLDRQADVMLRLDASTAAIAASIASLAASDAPMPAIPPPQPPHFQAVSATLTATPTTTSTTAADAATTEAARNEILALAKSLQPLTFTAATDPVELRAALREHDKGWELDTEWQEVPPRQEEGGGQTLAQAQAQAQAAVKDERHAAPASCLREHRKDMNDWSRQPARAARESDCKFICEKGNAKVWCVESVFSTEDNGSCRLFAASEEKTHTRMNNWYSPPRPARESDCTFLCTKGSAKAWCVANEFSTDDEGSCRLSSCHAAPVESESGDRRRNYLLGQAWRRKRYVVAALAFASPFVLFGLAWACKKHDLAEVAEYQARRLYGRLLGEKKAKSSL